ncbi:uncharacterized protein EAE97_006644 [Botrytis byssoidea]|uniref:2EXR domain-containing protein n=1 Tax=Botrytis byssoidea TaxID=139641 RepID=A0A9P5M696_9HELO|nr:uncharacterized protein EAE97_006644 [Botrytis byssoidea]KAF7941807.1 hypothetical protein EAE97_006644 [Botrytis byssoidea]
MIDESNPIEHNYVTQPCFPFDLSCSPALRHTHHTHHGLKAQNRINPSAHHFQPSQLHLSTPFDLSLISRHPQKLGLRRMKKSHNLADLARVKIKSYHEIVMTVDTDPSLPKFADFPKEIRLKIWEEYANNLTPRDIPVWRLRNPFIHSSTSCYINVYDHISKRLQLIPLSSGSVRHYDFKWACPQPDILYINSEARKVGLSIYTQESLNGTICSKMNWEPGSETGPATIYRHINGMDRIMPMYDFSNGHETFWIEHEHQLEGRIALNAFLYDLDPNQPVLSSDTMLMLMKSSLTARERRELYDKEVAKAWAAVIPSTAIPPPTRTLGHFHPFNIKEITIYYRTESLIGVKEFKWTNISENHLHDYEGYQEMLNMKRAIKIAYQYWELQRYRTWVHYTGHMNPQITAELVEDLNTSEFKKHIGKISYLLLTMTRDNPGLQEKYKSRMEYKMANPRRSWNERMEEMWEERVPVLPKIQFAVCGKKEGGLKGVVRPPGFKL